MGSPPDPQINPQANFLRPENKRETRTWCPNLPEKPHHRPRWVHAAVLEPLLATTRQRLRTCVSTLGGVNKTQINFKFLFWDTSDDQSAWSQAVYGPRNPSSLTPDIGLKWLQLRGCAELPNVLYGCRSCALYCVRLQPQL